jgi:hypothetical protein
MNRASILSSSIAKAALLLVAAFSLALVLGSWITAEAYAQEPDVSAAASSVTRSASGEVTFTTPKETFSGTQMVYFDTTASIKQTVEIKSAAGAWVRLRMTVNLSSTVPVNVDIGGLTTASSTVMSGTLTMTTSEFAVIGTQSKSVTGNVTVNGSKRVTVGGSPKDVYVWAIDQPINGTAKIDLLTTTGSASLITSEYLPFISRSDVYFTDDFSTDKGWWAIADEDDCEAVVNGGYLKVSVYADAYDCFISAPDGVFLKEGTFTVEMSRRDNNLSLYGLLFNTGADLEEQRWLTQLLPFGGYECDEDETADDDQGCLWLSYYNEPDDNEDEWVIVTDEANLDDDDWNTLSVIRETDRVRVYVNGAGPEINEEDDDSGLRDKGLFDLKVSSIDDNSDSDSDDDDDDDDDDTTVVVWFDNFELKYNE